MSKSAAVYFVYVGKRGFRRSPVLAAGLIDKYRDIETARQHKSGLCLNRLRDFASVARRVSRWCVCTFDGAIGFYWRFKRVLCWVGDAGRFSLIFRFAIASFKIR